MCKEKHPRDIAHILMERGVPNGHVVYVERRIVEDRVGVIWTCIQYGGMDIHFFLLQITNLTMSLW